VNILSETARFGKDADALRRDVEVKADRLVASCAKGHTLSLVMGRMLRRRVGIMAENAVAKEILRLQRVAQDHLLAIDMHTQEVHATEESARADCYARMDSLCNEWIRQRTTYESSMQALDEKLQEVDQRYQAKWKATEAEKEQRLREQEALSAHNRDVFHQQMTELEEHRETEIAKLREAIARQALILSEARRQAVAQMSGKLDVKREALQARADREAQRCAALKGQHFRRLQAFEKDARQYKSHIERVRGHYRAPRGGTPRAAEGFAAAALQVEPGPVNVRGNLLLRPL